MSSDQNKNNSDTKDSKESIDPGLAKFKEEALQNYIIEKALLRPEANCCTYKKGYITQECFICLTCFLETKKRAILCLGCSVKCHDDIHEIIPIGFKRHIRCDCGNNNYFVECKLKKKEEIEYDNPENNYNHNMENKYCFCDSEDDGNSTMAQCFFCEDWFHKEHLYIFGDKKSQKFKIVENSGKNMGEEEKNENDKKDNDIDSEDLPMSDLVCKNCVISLKDILIGYDLKEILYGIIPQDQNQIIHLDEENSEKIKENFDKKEKNNEKENEKGKEKEKDKIEIKDKPNTNIIGIENKINIFEEDKKNKDKPLLGKKRILSFPHNDNKDEVKKENENIIKNIKNNNIIINNEQKCKRKQYKKNEEILNNIIKQEQNIFIDCEIFLKNLCRCESCKKMYKKLGFDYLNNENLYKEWESRKTFDDIINDEKFIDEAERENPISLENINGTLNDFFNSKEYKQLTCEQQIIIRGCIGEFSNKFSEFISTLNHTTITVEDIYAFFNKYRDYFEQLKSK